MARGKPKIDQGQCYAVNGQCGKEAKVAGLCIGHYGRLRAGKSIDTPLRPRLPNGQRKNGRPLDDQKRFRYTPVERRANMVITPMSPLRDQVIAIDKFRYVDACLVGDSMGVGKTVTGIGIDFDKRKIHPEHIDGPTLIICEKIGIDVWDYHLRAMGVPIEQILLVDPTDRTEFVDELKKLIAFQGYKPPKMTRKGTIDKRTTSTIKTDRPQYRYYVCHWDVLVLIPELNSKNKSGRQFIDWTHVIADEVHLAKNRKALRTIELKRIRASFKTGLSGTPADDKPQDIWSVLHWLYPSRYSSYWEFVNKYVNVEETDLGYRKLLGPKLEMMETFHRELRPFYIRRTLLEINPDMPEKAHVRPITTVQMGKAQRNAYESMKNKALAIIGAEDGRGFTLMAPAIIAVLTRLQQMAECTLSPEWNTELTELEDEDGFDTDWDFPDIVMSTPSPKLDAVMNLIRTHEEESFVVFTQFRAMADLVEEECRLKNIPVVKIHGAITNKNTRTELVRQFQDGEARVFVGTIAAAGKTITLTKAHHAIFTDRSWNPSKNAQAEDRLWRRTQKNRVQIIDIETEDSIDQWRREKIDEKGLWIDQLLDPRAAANLTIDPLVGQSMRDSLAEFLAR